MSALVALLVWLAPHVEHPESLALMYVDAAESAPVDVVTLLAVSYHESRFYSDRVSRAGACGIMQVIPKWSRWSCAEMQSDQAGIAAGVEALQVWDGSLEHYGGGNVGSRRYARAVRRYRQVILDYIADFLIRRTSY